MTALNILFRCSQLGKLMTEPRNKTEKLSETAKSLCFELFIEHKYGRRKQVTSKYIEKGIAVEEAGITSYNIHLVQTTGQRVVLQKNTERRSNDYITGEPDIITPQLADVKSSWDIFTFMDAKYGKLNKDYFWQLQGYMMLFGHEEADLVYTLQNTPDEIIERETRYRICQENEFKFDDMPFEDRIFLINVKRDDEALQAIKEKVIFAREFINEKFIL